MTLYKKKYKLFTLENILRIFSQSFDISAQNNNFVSFVC